MTHRRRAAFITTLILFVSVAQGADRKPLFDITPGPLQPALERLAAQAGLQLLYDPYLLEGRVTRGITGSMTPEKALLRLLENTDVAFNFTATDAVALYRKSKPALVPTLGDPERMRTVMISTDRTLADLYNTDTSMSVSGVDQSLLDVPLTSQTLSHGVLRDLLVNRLEDAVQYVSGAEIAPNGQSALGFEFRGFPTYEYYLDGVRVSPDLHHDAFRELANVERIDIIKGPASMLYGRTQPGGAINVVTKQPLAEPAVTLEQQGGSFGYQRTQLDAGGPLPGNFGLLYRFNAAYENQHSFRDTSGSHRLFLAPVVTWNSSPATSTTLYAEYLDSNDPHDSGLPVVGNHLPAVPIDRSLEAGGDIHTKDLRVGIKGSHTFHDGWLLRHHLEARWINSPQTAQAALSDDGLAATTCSPASCPVSRELVAIPQSAGRTYFISMDALRDFSLWFTHHSLLAGVDLFSSRGTDRLEFRNDSSLTTNLYHPGTTPINWSLLGDPDTATDNLTDEDWAGAHLQDQIQLGETVHLLLGGRFDQVHEKISRFGTEEFSNLFGQVTREHVDAAISDKLSSLRGRVGVLWHPLPPLSLYANLIQNFGIAAGLFAGDGNKELALPAENSQEWEWGLKLESPHGRMSATVAWYNLVKHNLATPVLSPALDNLSASKIMNRATNQGLEADVRGELLPGLQLLASYAYVDSRMDNFGGVFSGSVAKNAELLGNTGNRLYGVPKHGGSVWASYEMPRGLKLGLGLVARGTREGDNLNDYQLPAFLKVNALAAYGWRALDTHFEVQLNVDNLFDERYYESLSGTRTVMPGMPRRFIATVRASF